MSELLTAMFPALLGAVFGYLASVLNSWLNRNKNKAETSKIIADTDETNTKIQRELQEQVFSFIEQNQKMFDELKKERKSKREELDRMHIDIETLRQELLTVNMIKASLMNQVVQLQSVNDKRIKRIRELEALVAEHTETIAKYGTELGALRRATGKLSIK